MARIDWSNLDWSSLARGWPADLRAAAAFFTCLPIPKPRAAAPKHDDEAELDEEELEALEEERAPAAAGLGRALRAWPVVGLGVGLVGAVGFVVLRWLGLGSAVAAIAAIALTVAATGALHEDGLADFADGLGGRDPEERLAIMRDSRIGAFGILALLLCLGLRAAALAEIARPGHAAAVLIATECAARGLVPLLLLSLEPARADGLGASLGQPSQETIVTAALIAALACLILLGPLAGLVALAAGAAAVFGLGSLARRRLGGYTGDVLGAAEQVAATAILLVAAMFA
ncbi:MAG TPA: adenosylcobinamide-GDP ribazoletransferase [Alphaproteobacteria bacterium]|nr:adenosylcobinamide-GDP ribazoletransferase [Alphaproteobacteria bacterium]